MTDNCVVCGRVIPEGQQVCGRCNRGNDIYNNSHCPDPTAYRANKNIEEQQRRVNSLIAAIKTMINLADFELLNRIEIRDIKTRREYR